MCHHCVHNREFGGIEEIFIKFISHFQTIKRLHFFTPIGVGLQNVYEVKPEKGPFPPRTSLFLIKKNNRYEITKDIELCSLL